MWYTAKSLSPLAKAQGAYAESPDGVHWEKPELGLAEVNGSRANNLLPTAECGATGYPLTLLDNGPDFGDPLRRFMFMACRHEGGSNLGAWAMFSADGFHLTAAPENPVIPFEAWVWGENHQRDKRQIFYDCMDVFYDPARNRYVYLIGMVAQPEDGYVGRSRTGPIRRLVGQCESNDFIHWSTPRRILVPENPEDMTEFYNMSVVYRNGLYIGFVRVLRDDLPADEGGPVEGVGWTELAISRDGDTWTRLPGVFFDRSGNRNDFDHAMAWLGCPIYTHDEMWFYISGYDEGHKVGKKQIGLARAKTDRFLALAAEEGVAGRVVTKPFRTSCGRVFVNADCPNGRILAQVTDKSGQALPGYTFQECNPVSGDATALSVQWKQHEHLPTMTREGIRLDIQVHDGSLYAIELAH